MRILAVYKFYSPDVSPYSPILKDILERLVEDGHDVTVLSAQPTYNNVSSKKSPRRESINGVNVVRVPLFPERKKWFAVRLINYFLFLAWAFLFTMWRVRKTDLLFFNSTPAVIMGLWGQVIKAITGIPYLYHCQDMHPESASMVGKVKNRLLYKLLRKIDTRTCSQSLLSIVMCEDMRQSLLERNVPADRIAIISNFSTQSHEIISESLPYPFAEKESKKFRLLFAGNHGNFQALDQIVSAALLLKDHEDIHFAFMGEGLAKERMMQQAYSLIGKTVTFIPYQTTDVAYSCLVHAELGIVSLSPKVHKYAFPSKTLKYCDAGCSILAVMEHDSDLAEMVRNEEIGFSCSQENPEYIARAILEAYQQRDQLNLKKRQHIHRVGKEYFGRDIILSIWSHLARKIENHDSLISLVESRDPLPISIKNAHAQKVA